MKISRNFDLLLNVFFPLIIGVFFYFFTSLNFPGILLKNYFPDGLWAYAFMSLILIIWNRQLKWMAVAMVLFCCISTELFQYLKWLKGTADWYDILLYIFFIILAIRMNALFNKNYSYKTNSDAKS